MNENSSIKAGFIGGSLLSTLCAITWTDLEKTLVLGILGTAVSFITSHLMKRLFDALKKPPR